MTSLDALKRLGALIVVFEGREGRHRPPAWIVGGWMVDLLEVIHQASLFLDTQPSFIYSPH